MRNSIFQYLVWVLLPVGLAGTSAQYLSVREDDSLIVESNVRLGGLASTLLTEEMGARVGELVRDASLLTNPDPSSPLLRAAWDGDTVAALGLSTGDLTLSLALAEPAGGSVQVRATTTPFPAQTLQLFRSRTGRGAALYLRGNKGRGFPPDFGPASLPRDPTPGMALGLPRGSVLLPLAGTQSGAISSPAELLVGTRTPPSGTPPRWPTILGILSAWCAGLGAWFVLGGGGQRRGHRRLRSLTLIALPLLALWSLLVHLDRRILQEGEELLRGDMVRVLALLKDSGDLLTFDAVLDATGFQVLRERTGQVLATTLPPGPILAELTRVPLPAPSFPSLGEVQAGEVSLVYAILREAPGQGLVLATPGESMSRATFRLLLAGLGGGASLLSLGFLVGPGRRRSQVSLP